MNLRGEQPSPDPSPANESRAHPPREQVQHHVTAACDHPPKQRALDHPPASTAEGRAAHRQYRPPTLFGINRSNNFFYLSFNLALSLRARSHFPSCQEEVTDNHTSLRYTEVVGYGIPRNPRCPSLGHYNFASLFFYFPFRPRPPPNFFYSSLLSRGRGGRYSWWGHLLPEAISKHCEAIQSVILYFSWAVLSCRSS